MHGASLRLSEARYSDSRAEVSGRAISSGGFSGCVFHSVWFWMAPRMGRICIFAPVLRRFLSVVCLPMRQWLVLLGLMTSLGLPVPEGRLRAYLDEMRLCRVNWGRRRCRRPARPWACLGLQGDGISFTLVAEVRKVLVRAEASGTALLPAFVPGVLGVVADRLSRHERTPSKEWSLFSLSLPQAMGPVGDADGGSVLVDGVQSSAEVGFSPLAPLSRVLAMFTVCWIAPFWPCRAWFPIFSFYQWTCCGGCRWLKSCCPGRLLQPGS